MGEKAIVDWKTEEQFRENAKWFYKKCKNEIRMPYSEVMFLETVCATFSVMRKGENPNLSLIEKIAVKAIKDVYPEMLVCDIKKVIRGVLNGEKIGEAPYGRWFDFCCEFRYKVERYYSYRNIYCRKIAEKERKIISNKRLTIIQKDAIHLILTIELL